MNSTRLSVKEKQQWDRHIKIQDILIEEIKISQSTDLSSCLGTVLLVSLAPSFLRLLNPSYVVITSESTVSFWFLVPNMNEEITNLSTR